MNPLQILKTTFGYDSFRDRQEEVIQHILDKKDTLVIMPTGGGKSLCYQIPALASDGLAIIVSPLIALMNDQVIALKENGVAAATLHSNIDSSEASSIYRSIDAGLLKMLYVSPERLLSEGFLSFLERKNISLFAIDEAHCVSVWGNDFRPEYVALSKLKELFPNVPTIALTATADSATQTDIATQLKLKDHQLFLSSFERTNIQISAKSGQKRIEQIIKFLNEKPGQAGIIYCLSRNSTEKVAEKLSSLGFKAAAYHAKIDSKKRAAIQQAFQNDEIDIVCATIAFGMGIDKPNIRYVIHYNMPKNIEAFYQEIGRAGRDGNPSESMLFYSWGDYLNLQKFIDDSQADQDFKTVQRAKLERMWQLSSAISCRTNLILNYFGEFRSKPCDHCDNCLYPSELFDGTRYSQMALSALIRCKESLGINMLIDVLRGSFKQEIKAGGFDTIKTFGVGREIPFADWRHYIIQMINQGIIAIDFTDYSKLKSTPLSTTVLQSELEIQLSKYVAPKDKKKAKIIKANVDPSNVDNSLLKKLKDWRRALAKKNGIPAFVILHDKALLQIASIQPDNKKKLLTVQGIGEAKLEKYGDEIMDIVSN